VILWDPEKNEKLKKGRGVSFEYIEEMILKGDYIKISDHPSRYNQQFFVMEIKGYIWLVPFIVEADGESIFLKTAYPSTKANKEYGNK